MKCRALKRAARLPSRMLLYTEHDYDIPFNVVYESGISDLPPQRAGFLPYLSVKTKDGSFDGTAVPVYEDIRALAGFLLDECPLGASYICDEILKSARALREDKRFAYVMESLRNHSDMESPGGRYLSERRSYFHRHSAVGPKFAIALEKILATEYLRRLELADGCDYFYTAGRNASGLVYCAPSETGAAAEAFGGRSLLVVPRSGGKIIHWNGERYSNISIEQGTVNRYNSLSDILPKSVYDHFDEHGRAVILPRDRNLLPPSDYKAGYLVKVPKFSDEDTDLNISSDILPREPGFVFDARYGLRAPSDAVIIDDPAAASAILARSPGGIYHPADHPNYATFNGYLEDEHYYVAIGGLN